MYPHLIQHEARQSALEARLRQYGERETAAQEVLAATRDHAPGAGLISRLRRIAAGRSISDPKRVALRRIPLFAALPRERFDLLMRTADVVDVPAGTEVIREGELGRELRRGALPGGLMKTSPTLEKREAKCANVPLLADACVLRSCHTGRRSSVISVKNGSDRSSGETTMAKDTTSVRPFRELAQRTNGDVEVTLLWSAFDDRLAVTVSDSRSGGWFVLEAEADKALDVYYHPFAMPRRRAFGEPAFEAKEAA